MGLIGFRALGAGLTTVHRCPCKTSTKGLCLGLCSRTKAAVAVARELWRVKHCCQGPRQCRGVMRPVPAAAVFTFVTGASAQTCSARIGPGIAAQQSLSKTAVAGGDAGRPSLLECTAATACASHGAAVGASRLPVRSSSKNGTSQPRPFLASGAARRWERWLFACHPPEARPA